MKDASSIYESNLVWIHENQAAIKSLKSESMAKRSSIKCHLKTKAKNANVYFLQHYERRQRSELISGCDFLCHIHHCHSKLRGLKSPIYRYEIHFGEIVIETWVGVSVSFSCLTELSVTVKSGGNFKDKCNSRPNETYMWCSHRMTHLKKYLLWWTIAFSTNSLSSIEIDKALLLASLIFTWQPEF